MLVIMIAGNNGHPSEIGLLYAIGAKRSQIPALRVVEALLLATRGALTGLVLGAGGLAARITIYAPAASHLAGVQFAG